jgi:hypothetical protein
MVLARGDADHFSGLSEIVKSEDHGTARKRLFIHPKRVYHNGLVKGPSSRSVESIFGRTVAQDPERFVVELEEDLLNVPAARLNRPFKSWIKALKHWSGNGPIQFRRLAFGNKDAFDFLADEGITVRVMGPFKKRIKDGAKTVDALPLLRQPPKTVDIHLLDEADTTRRFSASHTIKGHCHCPAAHARKRAFLPDRGSKPGIDANSAFQNHQQGIGVRDHQGAASRFGRFRPARTEGHDSGGIIDFLGQREQPQGTCSPAGHVDGCAGQGFSQ